MLIHFVDAINDANHYTKPPTVGEDKHTRFDYDMTICPWGAWRFRFAYSDIFKHFLLTNHFKAGAIKNSATSGNLSVL